MIEQILELLQNVVEATEDVNTQHEISDLLTGFANNLADIGNQVDSTGFCNSIAMHGATLYNAFMAHNFTKDEALELTCAILNRGSK